MNKKKNDLTSVHLLALHTLNPNGNEKGAAMLKNLKGDTVYGFYEGFRLDGDRVYLPDLSSNLFDVTREQKTLKVSVNAIVGENGSGKSSIIDYIIRILNNLSAYILGENYRTPGAEHLHYVYDVYAELFFQIEDEIVSVSCENKELLMCRYVLKDAANREYKKTAEQPTIKDTVEEICKERPSLKRILKQLCYTIVTNYSLYSLCAINYKDENTEYDKEEKIRAEGKQKGYDVKTIAEMRDEVRKKRLGMSAVYDAQCWLQGLFYKNDGYQAPLVINPMRNYGRIDIQKEFRLAKERMTSLVFMQDADGKLFFNRINGKLSIHSIDVDIDFNDSRKYDKLDDVPDFLPDMPPSTFRDIAGCICQQVIALCGIEPSQRQYASVAWNYIVTKVLKIIFTYPRYAKYRSDIRDIGLGKVTTIKNLRDEIVADILKDHSHVTRKLYRSIYYLKYGLLDAKSELLVTDYSVTIADHIAQHKDESIYSPQYIDELLPPPFFYVDFNLYDVNDKNRDYKISFSTLSSGEKQITYTLSSFYYQLMNLDSSGDIKEPKVPQLKIVGRIDLDSMNENRKPIQYNHVCAMFDEVELYFHPEMQRVFIATLIDGLKQLAFRQLKSIQILLATHSPFILSDIPRANVLFLGKNGYPKDIDDMYTFGANIHTMLRHSFFLEEGTMGKFAQDKIKDVINRINLYSLFIEKKEYGKIRDVHERTLKSLPEEWQQKLLSDNDEGDAEIKNVFDYQYCQSIINLIQEPLLRNKLQEELEQLEPYV